MGMFARNAGRRGGKPYALLPGRWIFRRLAEGLANALADTLEPLFWQAAPQEGLSEGWPKIWQVPPAVPQGHCPPRPCRKVQAHPAPIARPPGSLPENRQRPGTSPESEAPARRPQGQEPEPPKRKCRGRTQRQTAIGPHARKKFPDSRRKPALLGITEPCAGPRRAARPRAPKPAPP